MKLNILILIGALTFSYVEEANCSKLILDEEKPKEFKAGAKLNKKCPYGSFKEYK